MYNVQIVRILWKMKTFLKISPIYLTVVPTLSFLFPLQSCIINSQKRLFQYLILLKGNIFQSY